MADRYLRRNRIVGAALALALAAAPALAQQSAPAAQPASPPTAPGDVAATVGSQSITLGQVDAQALNELTSTFGAMRLSQAIYESRRMTLDDMVALILIDAEAKTRGTDRQTLIAQEITSKIAPVTEADIDAWYKANPTRVQGATLDQVREPIRNEITQERGQTLRDAFIDTLKAKTPVHIYLDPPRVAVATDGRPWKGSATAKVEIVEFSDFQCPYCHAAYPIVNQVMAIYGNRVRLVFRNYPLSIHSRARAAAEAADCANDQGGFWAYHNVLFEHQEKNTDADFQAAAAAIGLDTAKFNACYQATAHKADIDADIAAGNRAGVTGTPTFFIDGRLLSGAQPFDTFKRVIEEELARAQ